MEQRTCILRIAFKNTGNTQLRRWATRKIMPLTPSWVRNGWFACQIVRSHFPQLRFAQRLHCVHGLQCARRALMPLNLTQRRRAADCCCWKAKCCHLGGTSITTFLRRNIISPLKMFSFNLAQITIFLSSFWKLYKHTFYAFFLKANNVSIKKYLFFILLSIYFAKIFPRNLQHFQKMQ